MVFLKETSSIVTEDTGHHSAILGPLRLLLPADSWDIPVMIVRNNQIIIYLFIYIF